MAERFIKFTVIVKKWFDKVNGNTYHSVRCVRCSDMAIVVGQFQYGYGEHYKQTALYAMAEAGWLSRPMMQKPNPKRPQVFQTIPTKIYSAENAWEYERENNYPILWTVSEGLKRDCIANGIL